MQQYPILNISQTGQKIKQLMKLHNYSVQDIQNFLGFSTPQSIYHWFSGRNMPTIDNLYALSGLFHVPVDSMLCGSRDDQWYFIGHNSCHRLLLYYNKFSQLYN